MSKETHIVSLVIHVLPEHKDEILLKATVFPNSECHHEKQHNKFILVFETERQGDISDYMDQMTHWPGVMSVQLCYHHCESDESLSEEMNYAINTS